MNFLFVSMVCGLEELLKIELEKLGVVGCQVVQGGVYFQGDMWFIYQSLMWSCLVLCIILLMGECKVYSDFDFYFGVQVINWIEIFNFGVMFVVYFSGLNDIICNSQYGVMKVKDVIVDVFMWKNFLCLNVDCELLDFCINVWLNKEIVSIVLDFSGDGLYLCGYCDCIGLVLIKEMLVVVIVMCFGWQSGILLFDFMCGLGILLIEVVMWVIDCVLGLYCGYWGFSGWVQYDEIIWQEVKVEVQIWVCKGLVEYFFYFYGFDSDVCVIEWVCSNVCCVGIGEFIIFEVKDVV